MDIKQFSTATAANEGIWVDLLHPLDRTPLGARIRVSGLDSEVYRETIRGQQLARMRARDESPAEALDRSANEDLEVLVRCTLGWEGIEQDGAPVAFSTEAARNLYADPGLRWLRNQVDGAIADRSRYLKG